jgi:ABC-type glycerol-3-phosphate transport system permease component
MQHALTSSQVQRQDQLRQRMNQVAYTILGLSLGALFAFPMYFMFTSSFKAEAEIFASPVHWIPEEFQGISQYARAFEVSDVARWYANSLGISIIQTVSTIFFGALAGYGFAKFRFRGRRFLFMFILSIMTVPFQILVIPMMVLINQFGWIDTYAGLIAPGLISAYGVFMMRQFAYSIPDDLLDAARIDGASEINIFLRIVMPLLKPAAASLAIITFIFSWNNFLWPLVAVQDQDLLTLPVGLTFFTQPQTGQPLWAVAMAVSTLATLPVALLFIFFQRYFIQGMIVSGIKG